MEGKLGGLIERKTHQSRVVVLDAESFTRHGARDARSLVILQPVSVFLSANCCQIAYHTV